MTLAPIAIFAFNRPDALIRLLDSLKMNPEFKESKTYIFIDGARNVSEQFLVSDVKRIARELRTKGVVEVICQKSNLGLAKSIISGINRVLEKHESAIILEDDLVVSENFLSFCNAGLSYYELNLNVASIQGFSHQISYRKNETYFLLGADCWGWATWRNRWQHFEPDGSKLLKKLRDSKRENEFDLKGAYPYTRMLERQATGLVDSWAIRWHASMFLQNRLSLYPSQTLVENYGQDGSGTHVGTASFLPRLLSSFNPNLGSIPVAETAKVNRKIRKAMRRKYGTYSMLQPTKYFRYFMRKMKR
jgi:GR25 family glycosyltransferase involved in LPS biosynthesis